MGDLFIYLLLFFKNRKTGGYGGGFISLAYYPLPLWGVFFFFFFGEGRYQVLFQ